MSDSYAGSAAKPPPAEDDYAGATAQPPAGGYLAAPAFKSAMDATFGAGKWRETGGWRSQAREDVLRAQGALTVAPGHTSAHTLGDQTAPGAHDISVDGLSPAEAAAKLKATNPALFAQLYPEAAHGGQGAHLHVGLNSDDGYAGSPAPKPGSDQDWRKTRSFAGGALSGAGNLVHSAIEAAEAPFRRAGILPADMTLADVMPAADAAAMAASGLQQAGEAVSPANRAPVESFLHGAGEMVAPMAAAVADPLLGAAAFGAQGYGEGHDEAVARGASEDTAETAGGADALIQGGLGMLPAGEFAKPLVAGVKGLAGVGARMGVAAASDAALGAAMQTGTNLVAQQTYDPTRNWYDQVPQSAAMMAAGGILVHGAHEAVGATTTALRRPESPTVDASQPIAPEEMPVTNAVRAYAGKGPVEAEGEPAAPGTPEAAAQNAAQGLKTAPIPEGEAVLANTPQGVIHGKVVDSTPDGVTIQTPVARIRVPRAAAQPLPGDYEAARVAQGAPLEQMPQAIADTQEYRAAAPRGYTVLNAIRDLGGIQLRGADGKPNDFADIIDTRKLQPGVVNNKSGLTPEAMTEALQQREWFGTVDGRQVGGEEAKAGDTRPGDSVADLGDLIRKELTTKGSALHPTALAAEPRRADLADQMQRAGVGAATPLPEAAAKLAAWRGEQVKANSDAMTSLRAMADDLGVRTRPDAGYDELLGDVVEAQATRAETSALDADHDESLIDAELTPDEHEWLSASGRGAEGEHEPAFPLEGALAGEGTGAGAETGGGEPGAGPAGRGEDQAFAGAPSEPGSVAPAVDLTEGLKAATERRAEYNRTVEWPARQAAIDKYDIKKNKGAPSLWPAEAQAFYRRQKAENVRAAAKGNVPESIAANDFRKAEMERAQAAAKSPAGETRSVALAREPLAQELAREGGPHPGVVAGHEAEVERALADQALEKDHPSVAAARRAFEATEFGPSLTGEDYAAASNRRSDAAEALHKAEIDAGLRTEPEIIKMPQKSGLGGSLGNAIIVDRWPDGLWRAGANYSLPNSGGGGKAYAHDPGFKTKKQALEHAADKMRNVLDRDIETNHQDNSEKKAALAVRKWIDATVPTTKAHDTERHAAVLEKIARDYERIADERGEPFYRDKTARYYWDRREEVLGRTPPERPNGGASERQNIGGETVDQQLLAGGERSARQAAAAREGALKAKVPQKGAGDLFAPPEPEALDLFAQRHAEPPKPPADIAPTPEAKEAQARAETPKGSGYGEKNSVFTKEAADGARAKLNALMRSQLNSGIDPEMIHAGITLAGYHVEAGARRFGEYAQAVLRDLGEWSAPYLKMWYNALRDYPGFDAHGMTPAADLPANTDALVQEHVLRRSADLEQGGQRAAPADADGAGALPAGPDQPERGAGGAGAGPAEAGDRAQGGERLPDGGAAPLGEGGAGELFAGAPGDRGQPAGGGEPSGGDVARDAGIQPDRIPAADLERVADEAAHLEPVAQGNDPFASSANAPPVSRELEAALPTLFPEQRSDIAFAEERFAEPDGHGVMFTNGTGTGKTFTGGGIVKRLFDKGKKNVLVAAPTQGILNHWKESLEKLGVPFHVLEGVDDHGPLGKAVLTTYANLANNRTLADRPWDAVVADESHSLSSDMNGSETTALANFRAITNHPDRLRLKAELQLRKAVDKLIPLKDAIPKGATSGPAYDRWTEARQKLDEQIAELVAKFKGEDRAKAVFLSATPFAYDKSIDYAHGYLFDYGPAKQSSAYNSPNARDAFMIQHFGYRMRYGKLTKPEAAVESDVMERQFHEWLRRTGALSGRVLNVDKDYDRKFALIADGLGSKIDQALDFLANADDGKFRPFADIVRKRFDYLSRQRLLEAIKAKHAIPRILAHRALDRKVVVFHNYNEGGGFNPFAGLEHVQFEPGADGKRIDGAALHAEFMARNPYVADIEAEAAGLASPLVQLQTAFPDALIYNGTVPKGQRERAKQLFNQDGGRHNLIIVQSEAGQAGISLHDTTGRHQRAIENLGMPGRPTAAIQQEGRIYRIGQASDAIFRYMNTGTNWERHAFATTIAQRAGTAENLALGDQARTMRESFISAFLDSAPYPPARGEGKGGKAADRELAKALTEFQKAKSYYYAEGKKGGRRDAREGKDYFATPEPLGLKMAEWADIQPGEDALEPSAGHGAIARFLPETANRTLIEPSTYLASRAALSSPGAKVLEHGFEDLHAVNKYDAIVMNPPFGHAGATAIEHLKLAMGHLRDGGRIVALIPRGATDAKFEALMDSPAAKHVYSVATYDLPPITFERAGTKVSSRVVVLEKQEIPVNRDRMRQEVRRDYAGETKIGGLFDRLEDSTIPERVRGELMGAETRSAAETRRDEKIVADTNVAFDTAQVLHGKTGAPLYVATAKERMESDAYRAMLALAKKHGGYYSSFRGKGAVPGFQFPSEASRAAFTKEATSTSAPKFQRVEGEGPRDLFQGVEPITPRPAEGTFARPAPDQARAHFDQNHADLYRLAQRGGTPEQRQAEAGRMATDMGKFMDWSDDEAASAAAKSGRPTPADMMRAARDYAREFDATGKQSHYDADAYHDLMQRWYERQGGERPQFQRQGEGAPIFYSAVERLIDTSPMKSASADQWKATLSNAPGIKKEELSWLGVGDWLDLFGKGDKVPKEKLQAFLRDNGVHVDEVVAGSQPGNRELEAKVQARAQEIYDEKTSAIVERMREWTPDASEQDLVDGARNEFRWDNAEEEARAELIPETEYHDWKLPGGSNYHELLLTLPKEAKPPATHWETPGVMAHVRFDERQAPDGKKVLFVEEIQSDWHQKGRDQGYAQTASPEEIAAAHQADLDADRAFREAADELHTALEKAPAELLRLAIERQARNATQLIQLSRHQIVEVAQRLLPHMDESERAPIQTVYDAARAAELRSSEAAQRRANAEGRTGIPDAPFKSSWPALVMKRVIRWAVDNEFERVAWTTGEQQAERYDLTHHINRVELHDNSSGGIWRPRMDGPFEGGRLIAHGQGVGRRVMDRQVQDRAELDDLLGKELAEKLVNAEAHEGTSGGLGTRIRTLEGLDVKTGGEGMLAFYDRNLVNITNDLIKKHGGKVERGPVIVSGEAHGQGVEGLAKWDTYIAGMKREAGLPADITAGALEQKRLDLAAKIDETESAYAARDHASDKRLGIARAKEAERDGALRDIATEGRRIVRILDAMDSREKATPEQHGFDITPKLRDAVSGGQPLFQRPDQTHVGFAGRGAHLVADLYGVPADREGPQAQAIGAVADILQQVAPHARSRAFDKLTDTSLGSDLQVIGATYRKGAQHIIAWSLESPDQAHTAHHEAIHALRNAGLFTDAEWKTLEAAAADQGWMDKYDISRRYGDVGWEQELEESIAERFAHWQAGDGIDVTKPIGALFARIRDVLDAVRSAMGRLFGKGVTAEDVLRRVASGEVGARAPGVEPMVAGTKFQRTRRPEDETAPGGIVNRILGAQTDALGHKIARIAERAVPDPLLDLADEMKMGVSPMGSGSTRAQAAAKDFANELRTSAHQWQKLDEWLDKTFTRDQQRSMWEAADEHGVLLRRGVEPGAGEGLNRLSARERSVVENLQARADAAFKQAKALGMVKGDGLESYVPRMVVEMTAGGPKMLARSSPRQAKKGGNLSTTTGQLRQRKYETVEETEAAAKEHFGSGALVVRNIRTLGLGTQRLEQAIAGRTLVNRIKEMSGDAGADLVVENGRPDPYNYFTLDHPALKQWRPKFVTSEETGKTVAAVDQNGDTVFESHPVWVSKEFEGPLKAVLSTPSSGVVRALMDMKAKAMSVIMYSPLMHNAVIWGKAIPADPRGVLSLQAYRRGAEAKADPATMREAMGAGLDPIGKRFFNQDAASIAEGSQIVPGRSWTSQVLAYVPGLIDPRAGESVKAAIDKMGDVWHNTFLWDRVADLQMGLYVHIRDQLVKQGNTTGIKAQDAQRIAAHFANRYAGSLPMESMSKLSRELANIFLFSRSFTLGNLAAYKDIVKGLPSDVRSQVLRDSGAEALERVQGAARQKALSMLALDVGLSYVGLFMAAGATAWLTHQHFQPPWENEEDRQKRFLIGYQPDGTAIYGRLPTGKVGEELQDWITEPREILLRKLSPYGRLLYGMAANDKGFGQKLYLAKDPLYKNMGRVVWFAFQGIAPVGQIQGASDAATGAQDKKTALLQALAPIAGVTISKGAPGGPAMSDYFQAKEAHDFAVQEAMPAIRRQVVAGDIPGARAKMQALGIAPGLMNYYIRVARAPGARLTGRHLADFSRYATPEEKAELARDRQKAIAP